jgi:hypothetical protein
MPLKPKTIARIGKRMFLIPFRTSTAGIIANDSPNQVGGLTATAASSSQINLAWNADATAFPNGATYYDIERSVDGLGSWASIATVSTPTTTYSDTGLPANTTRYYRVTAYNKFGGGLASAAANATTQAATASAAPTGVSASASTTAVAVTITWTDASTNETGFYVYRNTTNTTTGATLVATLGAGVQTYTDNSANSGANAPVLGTTYYYWVSSYNGVGESAKTAASQNSTGGVTTLNVPAAPTGFTATSTFADSVSLAWTDASTNETGFDIEVSTNAGSTYSSVTTTAANAVSYSHTGRLESTAYLYRIRATNSAGSSSWVVASSVTTPAAVQSFTATAASSTQINLSWTDKSGVETGFRIERSTDNTNWSLVTTTAANATSFSNTGLTASTLYYYRIRSNSYNGTNDSAWYTANATTQSGSLSPSWTLDFSSGTPSGYTLTRASSGTFIDSSGYIASASTDVARLTHNSSGTRLGLLVEESRTNLCPTSETTAGVASNTAVTTSDTGPAPDNANTAELMSEVVANGTHHCGTKNTTANVDLDSLYVYSVFLKRPTSNATQYAVVTFLYGTSDRRFTQVFDLSAGSTSGCATRSKNTPVDTSSGIEAYANGWYRCWVSHRSRSTNEGIGQGIVHFSDSANPGTWVVDTYPSYNVTSAKDMLVWGHQIEKGATPSAYISNTGTGSTTRSADLAHVLDSNITSWGDPGALVIHFYPPGQAGTILSTDDASTAQVGIEASSTTAARAFWSSGSTSTGTIGSSGVQKAVHYWNGSTSKFCINGGTVQSGTNNLTIGNTDFVTLGAEATDSSNVPGTFSQYANCIIRKVEFYSGTLTDANLQTVTAAASTYNVEYLVIAGGGSGSIGGGGAGGYLTATGFSLTAGTSYTITVGAGGSAPANGTTVGNDGTNSVFSSITATGGGGGGAYTGTNFNGRSGGSGGGAGSSSGTGNGGTGGSGTSGQGNAGGNGVASGSSGFGGGGGANAVGADGTSTTGGAGGDGTSSSITGTSVTRGGGGGGSGSTTRGAGGNGGGGQGGQQSGNTAGSANTGGGGGAGWTNIAPSNGGKGVVILRIPNANYSGTTTGNPTVTTDGSFKVLVFNDSGSYTA